MRRTPAFPLWGWELESGEAIVESALRPHPFTVELDLLPHVLDAIELVLRANRLRHWVQFPHQLLPRTLDLIEDLPDHALRHLFLRNVDRSRPPKVGNVFRIAFCKEMLVSTQCLDLKLINSLHHGFPLLCDIEQPVGASSTSPSTALQL